MISIIRMLKKRDFKNVAYCITTITPLDHNGRLFLSVTRGNYTGLVNY